MTTYTGKQFWPLDPRPEEVCIEDIAHALSLTCRFGGHCKQFYSVAQHSCLVARLVQITDPTMTLAGLLHDAAEAYVGDLIRPIKRTFEQFKSIEDKVMLVIAERFKFPSAPNAVIKWADDIVLRNEHRDLIPDGMKWVVDDAGGPDVIVQPMTPVAAETEFLRMFELWSR